MKKLTVSGSGHIRVEGGGRIWVDCPQSLVLILDSLVGTYLGDTRSEVARFALQSWLLAHLAELPREE